MTAFPTPPRLLKGTLVGLDPANPLASIIIFQYNPETTTRTLTAQTAGAQTAGDLLRLAGSPQELARACTGAFPFNPSQTYEVTYETA